MNLFDSARKVLLPMGLCACGLAHAGASLPGMQLDLSVLDRNGAPFRYFHLRDYSAVILDHKRVPQTPHESPMAVLRAARGIEAMPRLIGVSLPATSYRLADKAEGATAVSIDELIEKRARLPW